MKNIMHLEDLAFFEDSAVITKIVSALIFTILHPRRAIGDLTIKYDGAPLVVFGNEEGYFVSHKGYLNKDPIRYRSIEEIEQSNMHEEKKDKLAAVFHEYKDFHIREGTVYFCDFLFMNCYKHFPKSTDSFQPNIIRYEPKYPLEDYRLGLIHHSRTYCGQPIERGYLQECKDVYQPRLKPDCSHQFDSHATVFSLLNGLKENLNVFLLRDSEVRQLRKHLNTLAKECTCYTQELLDCYEEYPPLANNLDILIETKYIILNYLNRGNHNNDYKMFIDDIETTHEGYVFRYDDYIIKLVDRFQFSKANFNQSTSRGWSKTTEI